jgi:choline-sulfatase
MKQKIILAVCLLGAVRLAAGGRPEREPPPDVFLITIDTLRADHVHCYGDQNIQTPTLDQIARDGIRFTQAFTPSPLTNSSHATIMTGLLPRDHGVTDFGTPLGPGPVTLAESLHDHGYRTAAFIGAVILDSRQLAPGLDRGFDFYDNFPIHASGKARWGRVERRGMDVAQRAEAWVSAHPTGPRFIWVHLYDPHDPYEPPAPYSRLYKDRLYDGEIAYADAALGEFISYLQSHGRYKRALIVVTGDHGEGLGEHGENTHGIFLYDSTTHIPLLFKLPGAMSENRQVAAQVRTTDILPTVLDVLGLPSLPSLDGESLKPYFDGREVVGRALFGETNYPRSFGWASLRSVREDGFKLIESPRAELYDLHSDSAEATSVYEPWNPAVLKMRAELTALGRSGANPAPAGAPAEGTADELRALGYLRPADASTSSNAPGTSLLPDPKDKIAEFNLLHSALLAVDDVRFSEARGYLEKVLRMDSDLIPALQQLAELESKSGNYEQAANDWKRACEARPNDAALFFNYGSALNSTGNSQSAVTALRTSLSLSPSQYPARLLLGTIYFGLNDFANAQDQIEAALLVKPSFEAQIKLAEILIARNRYTDAIPALKILAAQHSSSAHVYALMAKAYNGLNDKQHARIAQQRADHLRAATGKK